MRPAASLVALATLAGVLAGDTAEARDKVTRTVTVRATVSGSLTVDYGPDPGPAPQRIATFGRYTAQWTWTKTETSTYRRRPARKGGDEYFDRTVIERTGTLTESSTVARRFNMDPPDPVCDGGGTTRTARDRRVDRSPAVPPLPGEAVTLVFGGDEPPTCGNPDYGASGANAGGRLSAVCVWTCTLPVGRRTLDVSRSEPASGRLPAASGSSRATLVVVTAKGDRKVRNRLPDDF